MDMSVDFCDYFWGEKNNGFDVLYQNMKYDQVSGKELAEFIKERSSVEESYSKLVSKLVKLASSGTVSYSSFAPFYQLIKESCEKLSTLHIQLHGKLAELVKEVVKYNDDLSKKHKNIKDEEAGTADAVQHLQSCTIAVQKAIEAYRQRGAELEVFRRENRPMKDVERAELKFKKAMDDYKSLLEKHNIAREDFERKMTVSCRHFQEVEHSHLKQLKDFLNTYIQLVQSSHDSVGKINTEFKMQCDELTIEKLLETFVRTKCTGLHKPSALKFEELPIDIQNVAADPDRSSLTGPLSDNRERDKPKKTEGFLKSRRDRKKEKEREPKDIKKNNKKRDSDVSRGSAKEENGEKSDPEEAIEESFVQPSEVQSPGPSLEVDEEGFRIRPKDDWVSGGEKEEKSAFYSSTDTDSDDEPERRFHVKINPVTNGTKNSQMSASVDELRATVESISLSASLFNNSKKNVSFDAENTLGQIQSNLTKSSQDLVGLNLSYAIPATSSPYATRDNYLPLDQVSPISRVLSPPPHSTDSSSGSRYGTASSGEMGDVFSEVGEIVPALPPKHSRPPSVPIGSRSTTPSFSSISLPRPPSRRGNEGVSRTTAMSPTPPSNLSLSSVKNDNSLSSITERMGVPPVGLSRGPSPMTLGMSDSVPLAVAFQEMIHAKFKGTDETKCQVHVTGELLLSFPAGIIHVFANNSSPAQLTFRVKSQQIVKVLKHNNELINLESDPSSESHTFHFNMTSLRKLLKTQSESNPSAAYFNVDVFRYQIQVKPGAQSCPLHLVSYWKCDRQTTDLMVKYKYNAKATSTLAPLTNVSMSVPVDGGVKSMQAVPEGNWKSDTGRAIWQVNSISHLNDDGGIGSIRSRFDISVGPSSIANVNAQFLCEGTTLSGSDFELLQPGYRLSLVKKRFVSGSYMWEPDLPNCDRYAAPPNLVSSDC